MGVKSAQAITVLFTTQTPSTGAATDADSLPTGLLYVNGTVNGASVTIANIAVGVYSFSVTLPSLAAGDMVSLRISATVATIPGEDCVWQDVSDTKIVSELQDSTTTAIADAVHDEVVEGAYTLRHYLRLLAAVLFGKATGGGTTAITFRDTADGTDRVVMTVDASGDRSAVTLDAS